MAQADVDWRSYLGAGFWIPGKQVPVPGSCPLVEEYPVLAGAGGQGQAVGDMRSYQGSGSGPGTKVQLEYWKRIHQGPGV